MDLARAIEFLVAATLAHNRSSPILAMDRYWLCKQPTRDTQHNAIWFGEITIDGHRWCFVYRIITSFVLWQVVRVSSVQRKTILHRARWKDSTIRKVKRAKVEMKNREKREIRIRIGGGEIESSPRSAAVCKMIPKFRKVLVATSYSPFARASLSRPLAECQSTPDCSVLSKSTDTRHSDFCDREGYIFGAGLIFASFCFWFSWNLFMRQWERKREIR